ncbi:MAG: IS110 family transposase [Azoarcus sp.]|jgi:transposase|nr:IS110 family transposase [Azoarcus sp.]
MKYSGIDLHSNNCVVTLTDERDRVVVEKRLPNELRQVLSVLLPWRDELAGVVVESTYNWYWLVDGLQAAGFIVHLANTVAIKKYEGLKHSGDEADARYLAHLLRLGILPTGTILPPALRAVRDLARKRMQLVRSRTLHILAVENIFARQLGMRVASHQIKSLTVKDVAPMGLSEEVTAALEANVAVIETTNAQISRLEERLHAKIGARPEFALLTSIPGVGRVLATTILLEIGMIERFASAGNFASYARCVGSAYTSNGRKKGEGNTKNGNKYLSWAFVEAANFARRYCEEAKRFYERKRARTNNVVATKALAHKLARACYHILKEHRPFEMNRCFA